MVFTASHIARLVLGLAITAVFVFKPSLLLGLVTVTIK